MSTVVFVRDGDQFAKTRSEAFQVVSFVFVPGRRETTLFQTPVCLRTRAVTKERSGSVRNSKIRRTNSTNDTYPRPQPTAHRPALSPQLIFRRTVSTALLLSPILSALAFAAPNAGFIDASEPRASPHTHAYEVSIARVCKYAL